MDVPIDIKRMYQATENELAKRWKLKSFQITSQEDFDDKWLNTRNFHSTLSGSAGGVVGYQSGAFENNPLAPEAQSGANYGAQKVESGTFENRPETSKADTGATYGAQKVDSGTFENVPEASRADTNAKTNVSVQHGTFENVPEPSRFN
eukprot:TRINITY_DN20413_c0_g1_i1.p1 TRINITY_DN20413_c0_g1~~TRINITY_DN20413_c0_g1_i1.p1  ORF type:complete len:149 (+),score=27.46 TRINITY_DN20413_c0_g1_i1:386-832(+)